MSRNGSGTQSSPALSFPAVTGTVIDATKFNAIINDINAEITNSLARDGQATATGNLQMAGNKLTGLAKGTAAGDSVRFDEFNQPLTGTNNSSITTALIFTFTPTYSAYVDKTLFYVRSPVTNTASTTFKVDSLAAKTIVNAAGSNLVAGNIVSGQMLILQYDATLDKFILFNPTPASSTITSKTAIATTSGTSFTFSSIPSWVKRITVQLFNVSTDNLSPLVQLGVGGTPQTSGYLTCVSAGVTDGFYNTGIGLNCLNTGLETVFHGGILTLELMDASANSWAYSGNITYYDGTSFEVNRIAGFVSLSGSLDTITLTTSSGSNAFDSGKVNISYE